MTSLTDRQCSIYWWQLVIDMTSHHCHQQTASVYYLLWPLGFWVALRILTCGEWYNAHVALSWYYRWLGETEPIFPWNYRHINHTSLIYHNLTCWATQIPQNLFQLLNTLISFVLSRDRSNCWWNTVSKFVMQVQYHDRSMNSFKKKAVRHLFCSTTLWTENLFSSRRCSIAVKT